MSSAFSLERGKDENGDEKLLVPTRASELGVEQQRTEHYAFLEEQGKNKDVGKQAGEALRTATSPHHPSICLRQLEASASISMNKKPSSCRQVPCIKSCEADQLLELIDPVESESAGISSNPPQD